MYTAIIVCTHIRVDIYGWRYWYFFRTGSFDILAYKGCSVLWVAPVAAMVVALIGGLDLLRHLQIPI